MTTTCDISRHFLGWSGAALPAAARWLLGESPQPTPGDLSGELVVVPGGRAQRRLVELLAELSAQRGLALVPPTIVTVGGMADRLMPRRGADEPSIGDRNVSLLMRAQVLRDAGEALLSVFTPSPPGREDWPGWWSLAGQLGTLSDELGSVGLTPQQAATQCEELQVDERWSAIGELDARYHTALKAQGWIDLHAARRDAAELETTHGEGDASANEQGVFASSVPRVILIATPDLRPIHTQLLSRFAQSVFPLIFAPEEHVAGFDRWGVFEPVYWLARQLPAQDDAIVFVDKPEDQAEVVLDALARWSRDTPLHPDSVTVGLGDAALTGGVQRTLELAGVPARSANGRPISRSRPVLLLEALGEFASMKRFDRLAALLRHPDALAYAARVARESGTEIKRDDGGWLGLLDRYASDHLHSELTGQWLGQEDQRAQLAAIYHAVDSLLPEANSSMRQPMNAWARPIGEALNQVYSDVSLHRHAPEDRPVVLGLEAVGNLLETIGALPADESLMPATTFSQAISFVLRQVDPSPVPEPGGASAVELVGVLELALDDAARVVVLGVNEGAVPEPIADHPMLPRSVRSALGLHADDHRLAREQLMLSAVVASRAPGDSVLVAGRLSVAGDPLMPSRVLLKGSDALMSRRVARFFEEPEHAAPSRPGLLTPGEHDQFLIPMPLLNEPPLTELSVTAFRDYLACPYRFYLKHVRKLRVRDDQAVEMDGGQFGSLAHDALRVLGDEALLHEDNPGKVLGMLNAVLDRRLRETYGGHPRAAVRVQVEQLRYRLEAVARVQASLVAQGWRTIHVESAGRAGKLVQPIEVDGQPFTLTGKIDRIDRHEDGTYRVIDYKTSDTAKQPDATHRAGPKGTKHWTDLQLPLYADLCAQLGVVGGKIELAYFNVPRALSEVAVAVAQWDAEALADARALRDQVIRALRAQTYWPPSADLPKFEDGLSGVCADDAEARALIVERSGDVGGGGGDG